MLKHFAICCVVVLFFVVAVAAQEPGSQADKPKITTIPGGFYLEWNNLTSIGSIQLDKKLTGSFEVMFDVPLTDIDKKPAPVNTPEMIVPLADYWIVRGKPEKAIPLYRIGLEKEPNSLLFQNNLAMLLSSQTGNHEEALTLINKALDGQHKDNVTLLDSKGLILLNNNQPSEAAVALERAVELSCQYPIYCLHLAYALDMNGNTNGANRIFEQARDQLTPQAENMVEENKKMLEKLNLKYKRANQ